MTKKSGKKESKALELPGVNGKSNERALADLATVGVAGNAFTVQTFSEGTFGTLGLAECIGALEDATKAVHGGEMKHAQSLLVAQATALNALFGEMARRAALNMGEHLSATETYMRMAMKAQNQCRVTLETLANIKNPPVVFARQANINNGGQQQVNNGTAPPQARHVHAHAEKSQAAPIELLEASDAQRLDARAASTTGGTDRGLAPLGTLHRTDER